LFQGNLQSKAPFIVQISKGARSYTHKKMLEAMLKTADEIFPDAVFAIHLDHGDEATCMDCIASGIYSSVMIDASHEPFKKNIEITKRVVDAAHAKGISVEAELGVLSGVEEDIVAAEHVYTKPSEAVEFVKATGCDSLACAIGTSHGAFKFKGSQNLRFDILVEIQKLMPGYPLVMHGSSSVPESEVRRINYFGGSLKGASGVDDNSFLKAGKLGVTKINIDTDGRLVWTRVHREHFALYPENFDLRPVGKVFMAEYANFIAAKNKKLGSAGQLDAVREFCKKNK
jgi:fructose-bisphosphate aldolase class II